MQDHILLCYVLSVHCAPHVTMGEKLSALRTLTTAVQKLPTTTTTTLATKVGAVNAFYAREVRSLSIHGAVKAKPYYKVMHAHLAHLLGLCEDAHARMLRPKWTPLTHLNSSHLEHASEFL